MKKNFRRPSTPNKPAFTNNAGVTSNAVASDKPITSEEAMKETGKTFPQVVPATNVMRAPEQTLEPIIVNNIVMRPVDRTPKDVGRWRDDHKMAESIYFPQRSRLYDLYLDVILDAHLSGIMMKRIDTVVNKKFRFLRDNKEVEDICKLIETNDFRILIREMMLSIFWGVSGFEFIPGKSFAYKSIPRKHIKPEKKVIAINQTDYVGIPYENISNIWVVGEDRDLGLLLKAAFYVLLKKGSFSDWANYVEIFGQPMIVTKYDQYDEKTKAQLTQLMNEAGASLKLSIPKSAEFEIIDGKTSNGNGDLQKQFIDSINEELSVLILGNTETTKSSKSSGYAQSNTHTQQQNVISKSDVHFIRNLLNSDKLKVVLESYGYAMEGGEFTVEEEVDQNELLIRSEVLTALKTSYNLPISDDFLYEEFNIPKPDNYDELKSSQLQEEEEQDTEPNPDAPNPDTTKLEITKKAIAKVPVVKSKVSNLSWIEQFRATMANFFDQAHKD